jgi:hypothetical protein
MIHALDFIGAKCLQFNGLMYSNIDFHLDLH